MAIIPLKKYVVTRTLKVQFVFKLIFFTLTAAWTLSRGYINLAQMSMVLVAVFLVLPFLYWVLSKQTMSFERQSLICVGNCLLLSALVFLGLHFTH